jgi:hypothetical protein
MGKGDKFMTAVLDHLKVPTEIFEIFSRVEVKKPLSKNAVYRANKMEKDPEEDRFLVNYHDENSVHPSVLSSPNRKFNTIMNAFERR